MKALNKQAFKNELIKIGINYIPCSNKHHNQNWIENTHKQLVEIFLKNNLMTKKDFGDMEHIPSNEEDSEKSTIKIQVRKKPKINEKFKTKEKEEIYNKEDSDEDKDYNKDEDDSEESTIEIPAAKRAKINKKYKTIEEYNRMILKINNEKFKMKLNN
jgi:hypothetical protein